MIEIRVPRLNANDASYVLVEWAAGDGQEVRAGDPVAVLETSKAAEELAAEAGGVLRHLVREGAECAPGQPIARLLAPGEQAGERSGERSGEQPGEQGGEHPGERPREHAADAAGDRGGEPAAQAGAAQAGAGPDGAGPGGAGPDGGPVVTEPARRLMEERGIPPERVRALGLRVVRRADVEGLDLIEVPRVQRRIAEVVTRSHREIPAAYAVMRIDVTGALSRARELSRSERTLIGVPELVIDAVAGLLGRFPLLFAAPVAGGRARPAEGAHVGVTIDVGRGMFIPVVRHADRLGPGGIARELTRFRATAMNGSFTEADLAGGAITLTLHPADGVIMAVPLVPPGQICALALTAPRSEVVEQAGGGFRARKVVSLGLAYDHRYVNGMQATAFLGEIRAGLERLSGGSAPI